MAYSNDPRGAAQPQTPTLSTRIPAPDDEVLGPPHLSYGQLFRRFLRFGLLAWGGPVAQIAILRQELVEEERWVTPERFNRTLALYQVLPGPEAHELCVYFGMLARGRVGGLLAGLGFMLPGFVLMFVLAWLYTTIGLAAPGVSAFFVGCQAAVVALIVRAVHRIGSHALHDRWLQLIAVGTCLATLLALPFAPVLLVAGLLYGLLRQRWLWQYVVLGWLGLGGLVLFTIGWLFAPAGMVVPSGELGAPSLLALFLSGLRGGLLTFGGAYTVIPFLQRDAVEVGQWMSSAQFLDGIALGGVLPAPLIIFSTFVGYVSGGPWGALAMTVGIFLPAFAFTLVGHRPLEALLTYPALHAFLDGVTAGVVGLIAATTLNLFREGITTWQAALIFALALGAVYGWKTRGAVVGIVLGAGLVGLLLF